MSFSFIHSFIHLHSKKKMSLKIIFKFSSANNVIFITSLTNFFKNTHMLDFPRMIVPKLFFLPCSMNQVAWLKHSFSNKAHRLITWEQH